MKKYLFLMFFSVYAVLSTYAQFHKFGQTETKRLTDLHGSYTIEQLCIAPRTVRSNMTDVWLSKSRGVYVLIATFRNPSNFNKDNVQIAIDDNIYTLKGEKDFDAEVWGYTKGYAGAGGTIYTIVISVILTDDLIAAINNSSQIKIDLNVPSLQRIEIIEKRNLDIVKAFFN